MIQAAADLDGPVYENVGADLPAAEDAVERPAARELHHQAEVGLLQAHAHQAYDVLRERERARDIEKSPSPSANLLSCLRPAFYKLCHNTRRFRPT